MFSTHQPVIAQYARSNPVAMARVALFAVLSIQQPLTRLQIDLASVETLGARSPALWGIKRNAYAFWQSGIDRTRVYDKLMAWWLDATISLEEFDFLGMSFASTLPSFGLPKAGFFLQMCFGRVGCLDTHNVNMYGLKRIRTPKELKTETAKEKLIINYIRLCENLGGAEYLWNNWCAYVAAKNKTEASYISSLHVTSLGLSD
jgi:hypothetical protein